MGLYLPDGNKIDTSAQAKASAKKEDNGPPKKGIRLGADKTIDPVAEAAKKRSNLAEVGQTYNAARQLRQKKAARERRSEDEIDDEESRKKAKAILSKANEHDRDSYNALFNFFDVDKDGNWGSIEFAQRMTDIGFQTGVEDAANLLYFAGVRDVDRITYEDMLAMMPKLRAFRRLLEKDAMKAFSEKDDGSGFISIKALKEVIHNIAGPDGIDKNFVNSLVKKADRERTGRIPFDFFIRALFGSPPLIPYQRDMKKASFLQKLLALTARCFGQAPPRPPPVDDEDEDDDRL